ncbi:hypothetical protein Ga0080559_TMP2550 [Salipiger profundus]|uniref:Uncharacterized protein n=1 Tax=Salipiger profundus TaxID=1229727 RepID=A0A1U7D5J6_9RHOB|nr:hypothetical protein Ga0080559_TMP2550 [Salipiger profundus]
MFLPGRLPFFLGDGPVDPVSCPSSEALIGAWSARFRAL